MERSADNMDDEVQNVDVESMPQPSTSAASTTKRRKAQKNQSSWHVNDDFDRTFSGRDAEDSPSGASTPLEFVKMFWPAEIFEILARETNIRHMAETEKTKLFYYRNAKVPWHFIADGMHQVPKNKDVSAPRFSHSPHLR